MIPATAIPYGPQGTFDYSVLGKHADVARDAAARIRKIFRGSVVDIGRELIAVKERIEHGDFLAWINAECGLHIRIAQRAMKAAQFVIEHAAENDNLSLLPTDTLLALAVAPKAVVTHVLSDMAAGTRRTAGSIRSEATRDADVDMAEPATAEIRSAGAASAPAAIAAADHSPTSRLPIDPALIMADQYSVTKQPPAVSANCPPSELRARYDALPAAEQKIAHDWLFRGYMVGDSEPTGSDKLADFIASIKHPTPADAVNALRAGLMNWKSPT